MLSWGFCWFLFKLGVAGLSIGTLVSPTVRSKVLPITGPRRGTIAAYLGTVLSLVALTPWFLGFVAWPLALIGTGFIGMVHVKQLPMGPFGLVKLLMGVDPEPPQLTDETAPETPEQKVERLSRRVHEVFVGFTKDK